MRRIVALLRVTLGMGLFVVLLLPASAQAQSRPLYDVDLFARVPAPGSPEGIAIDDRGLVYVGTSPKEGGPLGARRPSKVFTFDGAGNLIREYLISGQDLDEPFYGLLGMAFDRDGFLYAVDAAPPRIIRLDPRSGAQTDYARFADVPPCPPGGGAGDCSDTDLDMAALPDYPVFAPDGTMYVTDLNQALIWRVPPGGGEAKVWFTDPGFETLFGPNGIQFLADGTTLLVVLSTQSNPASPVQRQPGLYELPVHPDGSPGSLTQRWVAAPSDVPDGFALAQSGNAYVPLAGTTGNSVAVVAPDGTEIARAPPTAADNLLLEVPFDQPASAAFLGERVLVTNHALFSRNPNSYAVLDVFAGEPGLPLFRPSLRNGIGQSSSSQVLSARRDAVVRKKCKRKRSKRAGAAKRRCKRVR